MQKTLSNCIIGIAKRYFPIGTRIGVTSSNFHNRTNHKLIINSYDVLMAAIMAELRWNVVVKDGSKASEYIEVRHIVGSRQTSRTCIF